MRKLGVLSNLYRGKLLIVKPLVKDVLSSYGTYVYDKNLNKVGTVVDIIGNVNDPRIVVKPDRVDVVNDLPLFSTLYFSKPRRRTIRK